MRADAALVQRGLARSRIVAKELIAAGHVFAGEVPVGKPSTDVDPGTMRLQGEVDRWAGRGAYKLLGALERFPVTVTGKRCIDVGASTGGFTQVLLDRGARQVVALDVGHGQLVPEVREDHRVVDLPGTNVRSVDPGAVGGAADLVVCDLSFISLRLVLDRLSALTAADGDLITLIKPQFEVGRDRLARTGVVRSPHERQRVLRDVVGDAREVGLHPYGLVPSPIVGGTGNREYLLWARHGEDGRMTDMDVHDRLEQFRADETPDAR